MPHILKAAGIKTVGNPGRKSRGEFARLEAKIRKRGGARDPAAVTAHILRRAGKIK